MWPFNARKMAEDDRRRLNAVEEDLASLKRRHEGMSADLDEFYAKVNRARQRVDKQERDARAKAEITGEPVTFVAPDRASQKAALRASLSRRIG